MNPSPGARNLFRRPDGELSGVFLVALCAVETVDFMTARWAHLP